MEHSRIAALIKSWFWLHIVALIALILQPSTSPVILGRYSRASALIVAVFIALTPVVWVGTRWLTRRVETIHLKPWQSVALFVSSCVLVFGLWAFDRAFTDSYIVIRLYVTFVLLTICLWSLSSLPINARVAKLDMPLVVGMCLLLLVVASNYPGLLWTDEGYMTSVAIGYVREGRPIPVYLLPAELASFSLTYLGLGAWYNMFGVNLVEGRVFTYALGLISLVFVYATVRRAYSASSAGFAVILGAVALLVMNYLRPDIGVVLCLAAAFYFFRAGS